MKILRSILLLCLPLAAARADDVDVLLLHSSHGNTHCYRIVNNGNKPLKEISVGSSWSGHPIRDSIEMKLAEKPAAWAAEHEVRSRHGYQLIMLYPPKVISTEKVFPKGYIGKVCLTLSEPVEGMATLPYAYQLDGYPNRITGNAVKDEGHSLRLFDEKTFEKDTLQRADEALEKVKNLKDLF